MLRRFYASAPAATPAENPRAARADASGDRAVTTPRPLPIDNRRSLPSRPAMRFPTTRHALFLVLALAASTVSAQNAPQNLSTIRLTAGMHAIQAQLAQTYGEREIGLMHRKTMPANDGMLFVFEQAGQQCFWMKNTLLPLSVAFVGDDGAIVNIEAMKPETLDSHCSTKPVRYVLEMNDGWFARHGIKPGSKLQGGPFTR